MEWEEKVKMIELSNNQHESESSKKEFHDFVLKNIEKFDEQAWDMFCNITQIIPREMKNDIDYWRQVYQKIKDIDCNDEKFGLRSGMRIALIQTVCEDELHLNQ